MQPDLRLLKVLAILQWGCAALAVLIGVETLLAWWVPAMRHGLPPWMVMKANSALMVLAAAASLMLSERGRSVRAQAFARFFAAFVGMTALAVILEYATHVPLGMDTLLAADSGSRLPGRMSLETAGMFGLLSFVLYLANTRRRTLGLFTDVCLSTLGLAELIVASEYLFGATHVFGVVDLERTSPEALLALMLLTFVAFGRRAEWGVFVILTGTGIGSRVARLACPIILVMPFLLEVARDHSLHAGWLSPEHGAAVETSVAAVLALVLVLFLAWRIEALERAIGELSLRDELTGLYNRRGFYLLAEQALYQAQRSATPLSVLFLDLDDLKQINDTLGHEVGSQFLREVGDLLRECFRKTDVIGRVGGDEFVVAGQSGEAAMNVAARRLEEAARQRNAQPGRLYPLRFSVGDATAGDAETLEDLLGRADRRMYEVKRERKMAG